MSGNLQYDFRRLNNLVKSLGDDHVVRVGILSGKKNQPRTIAGKINTKTHTRRKTKTEDSNNDNAYLGRLHEYGSFSLHIPPRSWLHMPVTKKYSQIMKEAGQSAGYLIKEGKMELLKKRVGIACEKAIQEAFETRGYGSWDSNAPRTIKEKGSDSPLIDTGQLRRAVSSEVVKK